VSLRHPQRRHPVPPPPDPGPRATTIDAVNKWLTAFQSIAIIAGVAVALWQLSEISSQSRIQARALSQAQQTASATLVLQLRDKLDASRYGAITTAIQEHDHSYPLLRGDGKGGKFRDLDIEGYIANFEDVGYLVQERLIIDQMAYDHFSYDVEKAWCNGDVQRVVRDARKADKGVTPASDPIYGRFENMAQTYLAKERQTCKDLDNQ
jgi:hypothetical protein